MAYKALAIALGMIAAASPAQATVQDPGETMGAPEGTADTRYCMWIEPVIGSRLEQVKCWTREEWAQNEVDVDAEWAEEGVAIIDGGVRRPVNG